MKLGGSDDDLSAGVTVSLRRISLDNPASSTSTRLALHEGRKGLRSRASARHRPRYHRCSDRTDNRGERALDPHWTGRRTPLRDLISPFWLHDTVLCHIAAARCAPGANGSRTCPWRRRSGTVSGPDGPLGGAVVTISDGQLTYTATTSTANGSLGNWSIEGIGTPSRYVVRVSSTASEPR